MKKHIPFGKYLLIERVNVGGMAEVFLAKNVGVEGFEKLLAIKRILPNIAEDDEFITMFIDEAKISVHLTHSNIAQIYDLGKIGESYFIAMEYISGKDMRAIFDRMRKRGEPLPVPLTCYLIAKVCEGLDYAHRKKDGVGNELFIVHRDVSPQNVLVSFDGEVKVIDFGIAKAANRVSRTQAGILKGKFGYMSPEQVRGLPIDRRSDVFAVGVCLYEQLTGERLFHGESEFSTLEKVRAADVVPPSTYNPRIPEALDAIVMKSLAKDVEDRYQWCSELGDDLQKFLITSDSIFSRTDLANFMKATFASDLEREKIKNHNVLSGGDLPELELDDSLDIPTQTEVGPEAGSTELFDPSLHSDFRPGLGLDDQAQKNQDLLSWSPASHSSAKDKRGLESSPLSAHVPPILKRQTLSPLDLKIEPGNLAGLEADDDEVLPSDNYDENNATIGSKNIFQRVIASIYKELRPFFSLPSMFVLLVLLGAIGGGVAYFVLKPELGILIIRGGPVGAEVILDGNLAGQIVYVDRAAPAGVVAMKVQAEGYLPYEEQVVILPGETTNIRVQLKESRALPSSILVVTEPLDAKVFLDGEIMKDGGVEPWRSHEIESGRKHQVEVRKEGYLPERVEWNPDPGDDRTFTLRLRRAEGRLLVVTRPDAARVLLDGESIGETPLDFEGIDSSRSYQLEIKKGGCFRDWSSSISFEADSRKTIDLDLELIPGCRSREVGRQQQRRQPPRVKAPQVEYQTIPLHGSTGQLSLNVRSGWAWVIVNGRDISMHTPLFNYELPVGRHEITLRTPEGKEQSFSVEIRANEITRRTIELD